MGPLGAFAISQLPLIQLASFTGVYGISFVIGMVNVTVSEFVLSWAGFTSLNPDPQRLALFHSAAITGALLSLSLVYGFHAMAQPSGGETVSVTVVQGNISQAMKWKPELQKLNLEKHIRLTHDAVSRDQTSLIVWPETAVQGFLPQDLYLLSIFAKLV